MTLLSTALLLFICSFFGVAARAFQQLNVKDLNFRMIPYGSFAIALCDALVVISFVVKPAWYMFIFAGAGGTLGCWMTMYLYKRRKDYEQRG
jgi:cellobiose-specific phosphotransferase system component IIC